MADVRPFRALRPADHLAARVIAPPYDVLSTAEARAIAADPASFIHITRSEVGLAEDADPHSDEAYRLARTQLDRLRHEGALVQDTDATFYVYGQKMGDHVQHGLLAACSVAEYDAGQIRKHEYTRPDKEDDRTHHMEVLDAQVGLVFLTYRAQPSIDRIVGEVIQGEPAWRVHTPDDVEHALWPVPTSQVAALQGAFTHVPRMYIADGHHRSAAASRVHANRGDAASAWFLAGIFPDSALMVLPYNRVVHDLHGLTDDAFLAAVDARFHRTPGAPVPADRQQFSMYFGGSWWQLIPRDGLFDAADPVASLDVSILQDHLLQPILGIDDPRRSTRIDFVGGIRGPEALSAAVDRGAAVAFHLHPTGLDQLFSVADADAVMPPKSTWFEPKLREGVVVRLLEGDQG